MTAIESYKNNMIASGYLCCIKMIMGSKVCFVRIHSQKAPPDVVYPIPKNYIGYVTMIAGQYVLVVSKNPF